MIGAQILHYRILDKLGEGGMGEVYLGEDLNVGRRVALKFLSPEAAADPESRQRFQHEARAQGMVSHPNIAMFHEVAEAEGRVFIAMEYVDGQPLSVIARNRELHPTEVLDVTIQIAEGLQAAHEHAVVHRDIKPANIMITAKGQAKITDFGLARWKDASTLTRKGTRLGTAYYMSPEQVEAKRVDHRADIYSLGVILYELLCRRHPFEGDSEAIVLYEILHSQPQPLARYCRDVPQELEHIVRKCLARDPSERFQSAADLAAELKQVKRHLESGEVDTTYPRLHIRRHTVIRYTAIAAFLVAVAAAMFATPTSRYRTLKWIGLNPTPPGRHLAIIPFRTLTDSVGREALVAGLVETVTSKVTQLEEPESQLRVIPASDVRDVGVTSVRQARRAFGATLAVTGSMQYFPSKTRVTLNLVDARTERQLRSAVIDIPITGASDLQDSICIALARILDVELKSDQRRKLTAGATRNSEAYEYYLRACGYLQSYARQLGGSTLLDVFQLDTAIDLFDKALAADPDYAQALAQLAEAYREKANALGESSYLDRALYNCRRAISIDDRLVPAHLTLGRIYGGNGKYEDAVRELQTALAIDSTSQPARREIARSYEALNQLDDAEQAYRRNIALHPSGMQAYCNLALFYFRHARYDDARVIMDSALATPPEGFSDWNTAGALYFFMNNLESARKMFERSLEIAPNYGAYSNLGTVFYFEGEYQSAATMYEKALELDRRDYRVWINLASVYDRLPEHSDRVIPTYRRAIQMGEEERLRNPRDAMTQVYLAECYVVVADTTRALSLADQALALAPDNVEVSVRAGLVYEQLGKRDPALDCISRAIQAGFPVAQLKAMPELNQLFADSRLQNYTNGKNPSPKGK